MNTQEFMQVEILAPEDLFASEVKIHVQPSLSLDEALRVKAAEFWLELGEADEALRELEHLSGAWNRPSAVKARVAALGMLRGSEVVVEELSND
jgi:hypothetical protein